MTDEELEELTWRLGSNWQDNWFTNDGGFAVSCKYALDTEGQWWCREELKRFLRDTKINYYKVEKSPW